jgi:hypothetical protein
MTSRGTPTRRAISIVAAIVALLTVSVLAAPGGSAAADTLLAEGRHQPAFTGPGAHTIGVSADLRPVAPRLLPLGIAASSPGAVWPAHSGATVTAPPSVAPTARRCGGVGRRAPPTHTSS